jgi:hypothetical protein
MAQLRFCGVDRDRVSSGRNCLVEVLEFMGQLKSTVEEV